MFRSQDEVAEAKIPLTPHVREAGRSLLWVDDSSPENDDSRESSKDFIGNVSSQCSTNVNQTESIRLDSELRGWFKVEPIEKVARRKPTTAPYKKPATYPVGKVVKSPPNSLTGSVYHMLIQVSSLLVTTRDNDLYSRNQPRLPQQTR